MSTVQLPSGASIWHRRAGRGAPLLQIHGSAFGHRNFERLTPLMEPHFEVIDFDLPGYGESRRGRPLKDFADLADEVFEFIRVLGYPRAHIHGTSFGAMIGLTLAARHPEVIDRVVLSCFLGRYDRAACVMRSTWRRAARDSGMEAVADLTAVAGFARSFYERPEAETQLASMREAFSRTTPAAFIAGTELIERSDLSSYVPQIASPTLLIAGEQDHMTPFNPASSGFGFEQIRKLRPEIGIEVIPECGHYLVIEQPARAAELIVKFLSAR
jgi:pimeloyl-ACP methyl ester carboxylesterase